MTQEFSNFLQLLQDPRYQHIFEKMINDSSDFIGIASNEGKLIYVNEYWINTLGWSRAELADKDIFNLIHKEDLEKTKKAMEVLQKGEEAIDVENRYI